MSSMIVSKSEPIALIGGGQLYATDLDDSRTYASNVVGVDSGASAALRGNIVPDWIIGDLDSVDAQTLAAVPKARVLRMKDQDTTDFDKALRSVEAPIVLGFGFTGARLDHELAVFHTIVAQADQRCIIVGEETIVFLCPPRFEINIVTDAFSLFPMGAVRGTSQGLDWPIDGLEFAPASCVGTSNASNGGVTLEMDQPLMLVMLPREFLAQTIAALCAAPVEWPVRGK